ncbi:MAG TPA: hypothetical protein VGK48_09410 [Terriglobia bacterium]
MASTSDSGRCPLKFGLEVVRGMFVVWRQTHARYGRAPGRSLIPAVSVQQWVLSPFALRYRVAFDGALLNEVLGIFVRAVFGSLKRRGNRSPKNRAPPAPLSLLCRVIPRTGPESR